MLEIIGIGTIVILSILGLCVLGAAVIHIIDY